MLRKSFLRSVGRRINRYCTNIENKRGYTSLPSNDMEKTKISQENMIKGQEWESLRKEIQKIQSLQKYYHEEDMKDRAAKEPDGLLPLVLFMFTFYILISTSNNIISAIRASRY